MNWVNMSEPCISCSRDDNTVQTVNVAYCNNNSSTKHFISECHAYHDSVVCSV